MYRVRLNDAQHQELNRRAHAPGVKPRTRDRLGMVRLSAAVCGRRCLIRRDPGESPPETGAEVEAPVCGKHSQTSPVARRARHSS
jgi:hypothetical protein